MKNFNLFLFSVTLLSAFSYFTFTKIECFCENKADPNLLRDHIQHLGNPIATSSAPSKSADDLVKIVIALTKYKTDHRSYPISSGQGKNWDGLYSRYGESRNNWIAGLAPDYIVRLPRDPRNSNSDIEQYFYKSDGANFKLIAHHPNDCNEVKKIAPQLVDPKRDCVAYGYWTKKAAGW